MRSTVWEKYLDTQHHITSPKGKLKIFKKTIKRIKKGQILHISPNNGGKNFKIAEHLSFCVLLTIFLCVCVVVVCNHNFSRNSQAAAKQHFFLKEKKKSLRVSKNFT